MAYFRCGGGVPSSVKTLPTYKTASGSVATFETDMTENLISCVADIVATQSGSGTPSPSNPRPISGHSSCTVTANSTPYVCNFGQTVYGGTVDVCTGVMTLTHIGAYLTGSSIRASWYNADIDRNTIGFYCDSINFLRNTGLPEPTESGGVYDYCQTALVYNNDVAWEANLLFISGTFNRFEIRIPKSVLADVSSGANALSSGQDYMDNNPLQIWYKIAPMTIQANALQIPTASGANTISADTGDISCKFVLSVGEALRQG
jgi:hypothetical protein